VGDWHPILVAVELSPGHWEMRAQYGMKYGDVRIVKRGDDVGYRAIVLPVGSDRPFVVGYYRTLKAAVTAVRGRWTASHGPGGPPAASWG
jgi:hypothetical protein